MAHQEPGTRQSFQQECPGRSTRNATHPWQYRAAATSGWPDLPAVGRQTPMRVGPDSPAREGWTGRSDAGKQGLGAVPADLSLRASQRDGSGGGRPARRAGGLLQSRGGGPVLAGAHGSEPPLPERDAVAARVRRRHDLRLPRRAGCGRTSGPRPVLVGSDAPCSRAVRIPYEDGSRTTDNPRCGQCGRTLRRRGHLQQPRRQPGPEILRAGRGRCDLQVDLVRSRQEQGVSQGPRRRSHGRSPGDRYPGTTHRGRVGPESDSSPRGSMSGTVSPGTIAAPGSPIPPA